MSDVNENIDAINDFFHRPENAPRTAQARVVFNEWVTWYEDRRGSWWNGDAEYDHARNLRNDYNRAQAVTPAEKAKVEQVIRTGITSEQQAGETDRRNASGDFIEKPPGVAHSWWFWPAVAFGAGVAAVAVVPRLVKLAVGVPPL